MAEDQRGLAGWPAAAWGAALAFAAFATGAAAAGIDSYGRLPTLEQVRLSPGGDRLAFVGANQNDRLITVIATDGSGKPVVMKAGALKLRAMEWADDTHLVIETSETAELPPGYTGSGGEVAHASVFNVLSGKVTVIQPPDNTEASNSVLGFPAVRTVNGRKVLLFKAISFREHRGVITLYSMDLASGAVRMLDQGGLTEQQIVIGPDGQEIAQTFFEKGRWTVRVKTAAGWRAQTVEAPIDVPDVAGLGPGGDTVLVQGVGTGAERDGYRQLSLKDGSWLDGRLKAAGFLHRIDDGLPVAEASDDENRAVAFFDAAVQKRWAAIGKAFPGEQVDFVSACDDYSKFVVRVFGQTTGAAYMLVDIKAGKAELIGDIYKDVQPADIAQTRAIAYAAADGLKIPAYLTLPRGRPAKGLPLVVLPHGGPAARDALDFDWWAQALASRGYAVLQPQFRGSAGFGEDFRAKGFGEWGRKMQTDLSDGVHYLAGQGTIDPNRVCIVGGSYGGYAALAGVALDPGVYRCAVAVAGIADLKRMLAWEQARSGQNSTTLPYFERYMGAESQRDPSLATISPITYATKIAAPVLLIHGKDDTVVPIEQSQMMAAALKAAGKPVELVTLPGEDHWLSRSETRLQMLQATARFLEAHNPPDPASTAQAAR
jgi:dipeptidyl aminopeptidase/acylaminoacyl peptidase